MIVARIVCVRALAVLAAVGGVALVLRWAATCSPAHVADHGGRIGGRPVPRRCSARGARRARARATSAPRPPHDSAAARVHRDARGAPRPVHGLPDPVAQYAAVQAATAGSWRRPRACGSRRDASRPAHPRRRRRLAGGARRARSAATRSSPSTASRRVGLGVRRRARAPRRASPGRTSTLRVQRVGGLDPVDVHVVRVDDRRPTPSPPATSGGARRSVRVIRVRSFSHGTADAIRALARDQRPRRARPARRPGRPARRGRVTRRPSSCSRGPDRLAGAVRTSPEHALARTAPRCRACGSPSSSTAARRAPPRSSPPPCRTTRAPSVLGSEHVRQGLDPGRRSRCAAAARSSSPWRPTARPPGATCTAWASRPTCTSRGGDAAAARRRSPARRMSCARRPRRCRRTASSSARSSAAGASSSRSASSSRARR